MSTDEIFAFWRAELARLDLLLHRQILRLRTAYRLSLDEFRGLYVSDQQVDDLLRQASADADVPEARVLAERSAVARAANHAGIDGSHPLRRAAAAFALEPFEEDVLLLALAPEIDVKYETLLAYLNNDVTRKWPTNDLALRLLSPSPSPDAGLRRYLDPSAKLFRRGLLRPVAGPHERPSWLSAGFTLAPPLAQYLLGVEPHRLTLPAGVRWISTRGAGEDEADLIAHDLAQELKRWAAAWVRRSGGESPPTIVFESRDRLAARQASALLCREVGAAMLVVEAEAARAGGEVLPGVCEALQLVGALTDSAVVLEDTGALFDAEDTPHANCARWVDLLAPRGLPLILIVDPGVRWSETLRGRRVIRWQIDDPDCARRRRLWQRALIARGVEVEADMLDEIATRFTLTADQIRAAALDSFDRACNSGSPSSADTLRAAARDQSGQYLGRLAAKVACRHEWNDLVLPPPVLAQIKDVAAAIRHRHTVYRDWGFKRRVTGSTGLAALFAGPSGTGKTMAAGVIARDLGLDLYRVDLSGVVSKYIGETEKNLDRIFRAAHSSNAILFFDEADALFGKRSEVKDAHDRYANIEVAYLLQKLEAHEGAVLLATNLSGNIDDAFCRRMQYVVRFPFPAEAQRRALWRAIFPPEAPLADDIDFTYLARQFELAGGDIRNVAMHAAFLAAADGRVITAELMDRALHQQLLKQGRMPTQCSQPT